MSGLTQVFMYGVHSLTTFRRSNGLPYGTALVVESGEFKMQGEVKELYGGSARFSWDIEDGDIKSDLAFNVSEFPDWLFEVFGGKAPTVGSAEPSGNVSTPANVMGTSTISAAGIATITATTPADLKLGRYTVKSTGAAALEVYCMSNVDFGRGTSETFIDNSLKIFSVSGLTANQVVAVTGFGLTITMGASAPAMVTGDTAFFDVRPVNTFNRTVKIGGAADVFPEFSAALLAQKKGQGGVDEIIIYRAKSIGINLGAKRKAFSQSDFNAKVAYDPAQDAVCQVTQVA